MQNDDLNAAAERINEGAAVASIEPSLMEHVWKAISSIPKELRQAAAAGHHAVALADPGILPQDAEQRVALMLRYTMLDALAERGILDEYMKDDSLRKSVFAAAARFPFDKNDLGEALAQTLARGLPPDAAQKTIEELRQAGYDPDQPTVGKKFLEWMRDNCS